MRIFVSYRKINRILVDELVSDLGEMGHRVFYDQQLEGDEEWWSQHLGYIRDCDVFLHAITAESLASYLCAVECAYAHALKKNILLVSLSPSIDLDSLPVVLKECLFVDYSDRDKRAFKALAIAIRNLPPVEELPEPLPPEPEKPVSPLAAVRAQLNRPILTHEEQVSILYQLRGFLTNPDYVGEARELLERLSEHPSLLAVVLRDIWSTLITAPQPRTVTVSLPQSATDGRRLEEPRTKSAPETAQLQIEDGVAEARKDPALEHGETADDEVVMTDDEDVPLITRVEGKILSSPSGSADGVWELVPDRLIFTSNSGNIGTIEIALDGITNMAATRNLFRRVIEIQTQSGDEYTISIGDRNREELIAIIQDLQSKLTEDESSS